MKPKTQKNKNPLLNRLSTLLFYISLFVFIVALAFPHNPAGNWYQQFMPNINGASIRDITFTDSLNGYSVTSIGGSNSYMLKTTNSGDNWVIKFMHTQPFVRVHFINANTGFTNAFQTIFKTTNAGENWSPINLPGIFGDDMFVLSEDTIWLAMSESLTGGVFRTTNGGASWEQQLSLGSQNPSKIYMFNGRIGFFSSIAGLYKTTNSGMNWFVVSNDFSFSDMFMIDSLIGWKASGFMKKTTNGGLNWVNQTLPSGGNILVTSIEKFTNFNTDTLYGVSGYANTGSGARGIVYRTTNGGDTWLFQIPDSTINIFRYFHTEFTNKNNGWAYNPVTGIHTTNAGDPIWYTPVTQISSEVPKEYKLFNNYPNPFNPSTNIKYQIVNSKYVTIKIFDVTGKEITTLVNEKQNPGTYETTFDGSNYSSGVYFYSLIIDGRVIDTKKMLMVK